MFSKKGVSLIKKKTSRKGSGADAKTECDLFDGQRRHLIGMTDEKKACVISRFCCRRGREQNVGNNWPREGMKRDRKGHCR